MKKYTVNELLKTDVVKRKKIIDHLSTEQREALFCSIVTLTETLGLDRIESYEERVRLRHEYILKYPDQEHWDYGEYITKRNKHKRLPGKVSTYGNTISISNAAILRIRANIDKGYYNNNEFILYPISDDKDPYKSFCKYNLNRVIACTFFPLPDHLNHRTIGELHSNHINGDTLNNHISNLDWTTPGGNGRHGRGHEDYHDCDYILCLFPADSMFSGMSFIIYRNDPELDPMLLNHIASCAVAGRPYRGYNPTYIKKADTIGKPIGYPKILLLWWEQHPEWFRSGVFPVILTVAVGPLKGRQFGFIGDKDGKRYLPSSRTVHGGIRAGQDLIYGFYCRHTTIEEVLAIENPLTPEEVRRHVEKYTLIIGPYKGVVKEGPHSEEVFYITCPSDIGDKFTSADIYRATSGEKVIAKGCIFTKVSLKDVPADYPTYPTKYDFCQHWLATLLVGDKLGVEPFIVSKNDKSIPRELITSIQGAYKYNDIYNHVRYIPLTTLPEKNYRVGYPEGILKTQMETPELLNSNSLMCIGTAAAGKLKGKRFGFNGKIGFKSKVLNTGNIRRVLDSSEHNVYCCFWKTATAKEIQESSEKITLEELDELKSLGKLVGPYKFIVDKGPFCGHVFYITCQKENIGNFNLQSLRVSIRYGCRHKNCTVTKVNWEDVPPYPYNVLTEEVLKTLI